jgi:3-oxoadipyl-CoA thiolase
MSKTQEAYICDAIRTPIGRFGGVLSKIRADDLGAEPLKALAERNKGVDLGAIDDVIFGNVNQAGEDNRNVARMSLLLAGYPKEVSGTTVNRLCASGLEAVGQAARAVRLGEMDLAVAGGVEHMTRAPYVMAKAESAFDRNAEIFDTTIGWRFINPKMQKMYGSEAMPETGENVAADHQVSRADQDAFALRSQQRAAKAIAAGYFKEEINAIKLVDKKGKETIIDADEHPRPDTTLEMLARLPTPFRTPGTVTAGNASGVNDGAAAMFIASEKAAAKYGLTPRARVIGMAAAGVAPRVMGIGPVPATERLLARLGMKMSDFDLIELNEAFASQGIAVLRGLGIPEDADFVNPNGGAIALGHPLGASGARLALTAVHQLEKTGGKRALCTLCIGVGQGLAVAIERV